MRRNTTQSHGIHIPAAILIQPRLSGCVIFSDLNAGFYLAPRRRAICAIAERIADAKKGPVRTGPF